MPSIATEVGENNMFERIIRLAIEHRWLVILAVLGMARDWHRVPLVSSLKPTYLFVWPGSWDM